MSDKIACVYIMTNTTEGTLYIGVTSNLLKRILEHKNKDAKGFTERYNLDRLVYYECSESIESAIQREKQLKNWRREWKIALIEKENPNWEDLSQRL